MKILELTDFIQTQHGEIYMYILTNVKDNS